MSDLRFYLDENVPPVVAEQLRLSGIDAVAVRDLKQLGDTDTNHLQRATELGRALCTHDQDFLVLAQVSINHAGIVFAQQQQASVGGWVRGLRGLHGRMTAEQAEGQVIFLSLK